MVFIFGNDTDGSDFDLGGEWNNKEKLSITVRGNCYGLVKTIVKFLENFLPRISNFFIQAPNFISIDNSIEVIGIFCSNILRATAVGSVNVMHQYIN